MTDIYAQTPPPIVCNGMNYKVFFISLSHPIFETLRSLISYHPFYFSHWNEALSGLIYQDLFFFFFTSNSHRIQATHPFWKPNFYTSELMLQIVVNTINKYIYINHSHQFKKLEYSCTHNFFLILKHVISCVLVSIVKVGCSKILTRWPHEWQRPEHVS